MTHPHQQLINDLWDKKIPLGAEHKDAIAQILQQLDAGQLRIVEKANDDYVIHQWLKKAILLSFRLFSNQLMPHAQGNAYDKIPLKFANTTAEEFAALGIRVLPGAVVRQSAYIASGTILMPCFINVGAYVGENTMIDTWSTVGSCAQVGKNCHISGGVGLGGVLEPLQANPVIIEDDCFIGARSEIAEGVIVGRGSVISMGVFIGASTKIVNRQTGEIMQGRVPPYSVVVPGTIASPSAPNTPLACAVIVKQTDAQTRSKTSINDLLREESVA